MLRYQYRSYRAEQSYLPGIRRFLEFYSGRTHPQDLGVPEIHAYL